jgi:hypothetical protein
MAEGASSTWRSSPRRSRVLLTLRDWLAAHRVTQVTMEATGVFWKPVWAIVEDEFELLLVNARHAKQAPVRFRSARIGLGGTKLDFNRPASASWHSHAASETSVLRPRRNSTTNGSCP